MKALPLVLLTCSLCGGCSQETPPANAGPSTSLAALRAMDATAHIEEQDYHSALSDMEAALIHAPQNTEYQLLYCMLKERTGKPSNEAKACYAEVAENLSSDPGLPCENNMNCVIAELMAESDLAETHMQQLLSLPAAEPESEMRRYVLEGFDRTAYLRTILP